MHPCERRTAWHLLLVAGLGLGLPPSVAGQVTASSLAPGDTVRYRLAAPGGDSSEPRVGTIEERTPSALLVAGPLSTDTIVIADLQSLDVARGTRNTVVPMAAVGAVVGCAAGAAVAGPGGDDADATNHRIGGCIIGLGVGIAAGIFAGGRLRRPDWVEVRIDPSGVAAITFQVRLAGG